MNNSDYKAYITKHFNKQLKKLVKHNSSLAREVWGALFSFDKKFHISIGNYIYKIRLKGNQKGKSGGYRMYIYVFEVENVLTPICIYSKSNMNDISEEDLNRHASKVLEELRPLI